MKGNPMKEKVIFTLSFVFFIGIMWLGSINQTTNKNPVVSEESTVKPVDHYPKEYIDDISYENSYVDKGTLEPDFSAVETCELKPIATDVFTFGDVFQYYRQCLGSDSSFQWKGNTYTTLLSEEVIIHLADSVQVNEEVKKNNEVSEIR